MRMALVVAAATALGLQFLVLAGTASAQDPRGIEYNRGKAAIISGRPGLTYIEMANDLATVLDDVVVDGVKIRVVPIIGQGSLKNIDDLLLLEGVDLAFVQADALQGYRRKPGNPATPIVYLSRVHVEQLHLVVNAQKGINSVWDLGGKIVNVGPSTSGHALTAGTVIDMLAKSGISPREKTELDPTSAQAIRDLVDGRIHAMFIMAGKPANALKNLEQSDASKLRLIGLDIRELRNHKSFDGVTIDEAYLENRDYPKFIAAGQSVPTIGVPAVLAAYKWSKNGVGVAPHLAGFHKERYERICRFAKAYIQNFDELRKNGHRAWRGVELKATAAPWERHDCVHVP